jgi:subtilase family serine protease
MENNNMGRSTSGMEVRKPDIVAGSLSVPMIDSTNTPVTVLWSVTNPGTGSVQNRTWIDKIFVSYDSLFNPVTAIPMGSLSYTTSLSPGASISKELTVTIPDSLPGPYYMFVFADATNLIYENLSEANNIARSSSQVQVLRPDLIVTGIDAQDTVLSGSIIPVQWTTKNNGPVSIINQTWKDRLYLTQQPVLVTSNALLLAEKTNTGTLHSGQTATRESEVIIPDGIQGNYYLFVYTDYSDLIPENVHEDNNVAKSGLRINPGPWADLHGVSIVVTDTALAGSTIPLLFTVVNAGDKKIQNKSWKDKVFISSSPAWNPTGATLLREFIHNEAVDTNATYQTNTAIALPSGFTNGNYYCYIYTDAENSVYENIHENNNIFRSSLLYINALPPVDLAVTTVAHIDSAGSGQPIVIDWTIKNSGNSSTVTSWYDGIYLSSDTLFNSATDIFLGKKMHFGIISPGVTYNTSHQVYLPNGSSGLHYLFVVADHDRTNNDQNFTNNARCKHSGANNPVPVRIILTPPPDLVLSSLSSPSQVFTGQPFTVNWTSVNSGPGATIPGNWTDKLYLSTDLTLNAGDIHVGAKTHTGTLTSGQDYTENLEITFPATISGNYILLAKTDHDNAVYEVNESNNTRYTFIVVSHPPPADLIVTNVQAPPSIFAGKEATITWNIKNAGANPASGSVKDMIYFSSDTLWDIHDILFGTFQSGINLPGNGQISRSVTAKANDIGIGQYFTIVKTDVLNSVYETNELNNHGYPNYPSMADVTILPLDMVKHDTMVDHENLYYRIPIGDSLNNSTLLTTLKADSIYGMNEIYQRHNAMPTRITYDFTGGNPYMGNQEVLIPSISEGNYYTLLYGNTMNGNRQHFSILAEILNFEIISVSPNSAGNDGSVTVLIRGSNFNPGMRFKLYGTDQIVSDSILFVDRSRIYATFNLQGASPGIYDMIADNYCMNHDTLFQSFEITNSIKPELGLATITPPNVRANRITSFTIEYTNLGNTNLIDPVIVVKSEGGAPIGLAVEDLVNNQQQLTLHLKEDNGPPGILRPGYLGTIVIYTRSTGPLGFTILIQN